MRKKRVIYLPIESYKSRYTEYTSAADGVYETIFRQNNVQFVSLRPHNYVLSSINKGRVLDGYARAVWCFKQIESLLDMLNKEQLNPWEDVIYFEDFWTGGFEMVPYMQHLVFGDIPSRHVPTYAFCHAQSTDPHDFTRPWSHWMRDMERGWAKSLSSVFCAAEQMVTQWANGTLPFTKLEPIGHIWDTPTVQRLFGVHQFFKENLIVFSSRFDTEKNPLFFIDVAKKVLDKRPEARVVLCSGHTELKSNDTTIVKELNHFVNSSNGKVSLELGLSKCDYFQILARSKVQFNCASQDFISYTLLEAAMHDCAPLYPNYLTFPDAINRRDINLYKQFDTAEAVEKTVALLDQPSQDYSWIWKKYQTSGKRLLSAMEFDVGPVPGIGELNSMSFSELLDYFKKERVLCT